MTSSSSLSAESSSAALLLLVGAAVVALGTTLLTLTVTIFILYRSAWWSPALWQAQDRRRRLPQTIILIRHGESEANADKALWKTIPDNLLGLTEKGRDQAKQVGERVEQIFKARNVRRVHLVVSPFERTLQTASALRPAFEDRIVRTDIESRIREQEVGNLQGDEFQLFRQEQTKVGRFWYRFPTGESGADVCDRVKSWWAESILTVNLRVGYEPIDAMVIVTHGLTIRFILMQLFGWSPTTFHSVWNAENCAMYVLQKDLTKPGPSPYVMDETNGDMPRSSINVLVKLKSSGKEVQLRLDDYLSIPPPRTTRTRLVKLMLEKQYEDIDAKDISSIVFMPFIEAGVVRGRSTSGVGSSQHPSSKNNSDNSSSSSSNNNNHTTSPTASEASGSVHNTKDDDDDDDDDDAFSISSEKDADAHAFTLKRAKREVSMRYPCIQIPGMTS